MPGDHLLSVCRLTAVLLLGWLGCNAPAVRGGGQTGAGGAAGANGSGFALPDARAPAALDAAPGAACTPLSCTPAGGKYCGRIGDGCGRTLECGGCPDGQSCGGAGVRNLCGAPAAPGCQPIACEQAGGRLCGRVGDGCGGPLECGQCPGGEACGASVPNVCGTGGAGSAACDNLCQQRVSCPAGQETTLSGTVFAPTPPRFGMPDPLYNALVYIPNRPVAAFSPGVACEVCGVASGAPVVTGLSGPDGRFTLRNVPVGDNIPLVIQIGRWRRQVLVPKVAACTNTALPAELTRLPRNQKEGNIPQMAIATGGYDRFECVLRKVGIDDAEFTVPTENGRVHVYSFGAGYRLAGSTPPGEQLVGSAQALARYDMVLLPCHSDRPKPADQLRNLGQYTAKGGRLFLTDFSFSWLQDVGVGDFHRTAIRFPTLAQTGEDYVATIDQSFPKGKAFAEWLMVVRASPMLGRLAIHDSFAGPAWFSAVVPPTQRWITTEPPEVKVKVIDPARDITVVDERTVQHFTFNTPVGMPPDKQCGRVVYSTFHVAEDHEPTADTFPGACPNTPLTPQEKALEFMLFDASACILPDTEKPRVFEPPPPAPPLPPPLVD